MKKKIERFGESKLKENRKQWFIADGERYECNENTIQQIWEFWIISKGVYRVDNETDCIFVFAEPCEITLLYM